MVPVSEILRKVQRTMDCYSPGDRWDEWFRMIENKTFDSQTPAIIRAIETHGFTDPVCIQEHGENNWYFGNGHHRLSVAILLGLDEIPVDFTGTYTPSSTSSQNQIWDDWQESDCDLALWISKTAAKRVDEPALS